jgi:hypothetical protein
MGDGRVVVADRRTLVDVVTLGVETVDGGMEGANEGVRVVVVTLGGWVMVDDVDSLDTNDDNFANNGLEDAVVEDMMGDFEMTDESHREPEDTILVKDDVDGDVVTLGVVGNIAGCDGMVRERVEGIVWEGVGLGWIAGVCVENTTGTYGLTLAPRST